MCMRGLLEKLALTPCARNVICTCEMSWAQCKKCYLNVRPPLTTFPAIPNTFNPLSIMTDFEQKLLSLFQTVFPGVDNSGCPFHFNQAVLKKVNLIGLKAAYEEKPINPVTGRRGTSATKKHIRRACAFVPAQDVPAAWDEISQQFSVSDKFDAFVTYFERTWVGRRNTNPLYAINKWNMRDRVLNDLLTTNNHVEGFHNKFSTLVGHRTPTVWTWLDAVRANSNQNLSFNALARWCSWSSVQRICHRQTKTARTVRNTVLV